MTSALGTALIVLGICAALVPVLVGLFFEHRSNRTTRTATVTPLRTQSTTEERVAA